MVLRKITCIGAKETRIAHNTHVTLTNTIDQNLNIPRLLRGLDERDAREFFAVHAWRRCTDYRSGCISILDLSLSACVRSITSVFGPRTSGGVVGGVFACVGSDPVWNSPSGVDSRAGGPLGISATGGRLLDIGRVVSSFGAGCFGTAGCKSVALEVDVDMDGRAVGVVFGSVGEVPTCRESSQIIAQVELLGSGVGFLNSRGGLGGVSLGAA